MTESLIQFERDGRRGVALLDDARIAHVLKDTASVYELVRECLADGVGLADAAQSRRGDQLELDSVRLLSPIDHPNDAHLLVSGTGLTHLGSAEGRDKMHEAAAAGTATDSMRMYSPLKAASFSLSLGRRPTCGREEGR